VKIIVLYLQGSLFSVMSSIPCFTTEPSPYFSTRLNYLKNNQVTFAFSNAVSNIVEFHSYK